MKRGIDKAVAKAGEEFKQRGNTLCLITLFFILGLVCAGSDGLAPTSPGGSDDIDTARWRTIR